MRHGELRTDLDLLEVAEWLALIQFIRSGWPDRLDFSRPDDPGHLLAAMALTVAIAPCASAAPSTQSCWDTGGLTTCQSAGNRLTTHLALCREFSLTQTTRSGVGYDPRFPALGS
jgi:hypothetical protein